MKNLKEARKEKSITQKEMADFLNISQQSYSDYENGKTEPDFKTLLNIAAILNVSTDYLLGRTDDFGAVPIVPTAPALSAEEREILALYSSLDFMGKKLVRQTLETLSGSSAKSLQKKNGS